MSTTEDVDSVTQTMPAPIGADEPAPFAGAEAAAPDAGDGGWASAEAGAYGSVVASAALPVDPPVVAASQGGPRRVRLAVSRIDPWSVMKMSFLFSVALGIAGVVMTALLWSILNGLGIFSDIDRIIQDNQLSSASPIHILDYVGFRRVVSLSVVVGVINIVLMTAIATLASFLYNISSSLVGGVQLTLTDD